MNIINSLSFCNFRQFNKIVNQQTKKLNLILSDKENISETHSSFPLSRKNSSQPALGNILVLNILINYFFFYAFMYICMFSASRLLHGLK